MVFEGRLRWVLKGERCAKLVLQSSWPFRSRSEEGVEMLEREDDLESSRIISQRTRSCRRKSPEYSLTGLEVIIEKLVCGCAEPSLIRLEVWARMVCKI